MSDLGSLLDQARFWLAADPDPDTRAELEGVIESAASGDSVAETDLRDRFAGRLKFGTAGLRGPLGAGPMRMNRLLVRQAAAGLMSYLPAGATVVVGYDARHKSDVFATDTAGVVTAAGGRALLLPRPLPTPVLAFAVRHLGADAGVMVTASHNPPADNGYKVYLGDGAQIVPPVDSEIAAAIEQAATGPIEVAEDGWKALPETVVFAYVAAVTAALPEVPTVAGGAGRSPLRIVYTAMHGVGRNVALAVLAAAGFGDVHVVAEQGEPDPDFPTVSFPNPEEPGALDLSLAEARRIDADLVIANDPDADRLAIAVPDPAAEGGWRALTGDQTGALLADHILSATSGDDRLVVTTIVSSRLLAAQASAAGVHHALTLTGFKWIMRYVLDHPEMRFVFGYEEALGYAVGEVVRDKDGLSAALAFAALAADARHAGTTVLDRLDDIYRRHGLHATRQITVPGFGVVDRVRSSPPTSLAGHAVSELVDLAEGRDLPPTDGLLLWLDGGAKVVVRPSGTEPKTKAYLEVVVPVGADGDVSVARADATEQLDALADAVRQVLTPPS